MNGTTERDTSTGDEVVILLDDLVRIIAKIRQLATQLKEPDDDE